MDEAELACLPDIEGSGGHSPANDFHAAGNSRKKFRVSLSLEAIVIEEANKPSLARQSSGGLARRSSGGLARQSSGGLARQSSGGRASDGEGSGGRRNSWERDGFGGISARKRPRTPRSLSPTATGELFSAKTTTLLGNAVDREDNRLDRSARAEAKKRGKNKNKRTPDQLMGEIGCSCAQCMAATNILSRGRSSGEQSIYLDEKSWLECFDRKHRYGSNLRHYYHSWRDQGMPGKHFWAWLDESRPLPDLACLPREKLEREVVTYLSAEERVQFQVQVEDGLLINNDGSLLHTGLVTREGDNEWIFVLGAADQMLYAHRKETKCIPRFHHTSFLAAEPVKVAGQLVVIEGRLQSINLHSGHYRPREDRDLLSFLDVLEENGVDLDTIRVDVQRMLKSSRHGSAAGAGGGGAAGAAAGQMPATKQPKRNNRKMWKGLYTRWFLLHKQAAQPLFAELRRGNFQLRRTLLSARAIRGGQQRSHLLPVAVAPKRQRRNPSPPVAQASMRAAKRSANSAAAAGISSSSSLADAAGSGPEPGAALPRTGSGGGGG